MARVVAFGNRHAFLTALLLTGLVATWAVVLVTLEGNRRIDHVNNEGIRRAAAVVQVCEDLAAQVEDTFTTIIDTFRQDAIARGVIRTPRLDSLDAKVAEKMNPAFCSAPPALNPNTGG